MGVIYKDNEGTSFFRSFRQLVLFSSNVGNRHSVGASAWRYWYLYLALVLGMLQSSESGFYRHGQILSQGVKARERRDIAVHSIPALFSIQYTY
jgi:hypothetical protein